ncbi:response regulator [Leptothoe sp. PORK10 BA2]|jgi:CheY-like chemotaxis protein|uniref:response regulator n=1 Tax=Leptothoe sp. PORK10 BA2 TaxID=3110254 RepID=UPI002B21E649|nr:response regulator [Leptothoe sp. PORK10 BA2]MEA5464977.1 response regulator [Leptothoe sp. PORK10 BA2]
MVKQILVVDDDDGVREIIQLSLEAAAGWDVLTAASGKEGIAIAKAKSPDLILLDVMMPDEDGINVFHQLQSEPLTQSIPTILLTAKARMSEHQEFMKIGVRGIITKPFQAMQLVQQIKQMVDW